MHNSSWIKHQLSSRILLVGLLAGFFIITLASSDSTRTASADHYGCCVVKYGSGSNAFTHFANAYGTGIQYQYSQTTSGYDAGGGLFVWQGHNSYSGWQQTESVCWGMLYLVDSVDPYNTRSYSNFNNSSVLSSHCIWPYDVINWPPICGRTQSFISGRILVPVVVLVEW